MANGTVSVNMENFQNSVRRFSPQRSIMVSGNPGIGKSQSIYQIAESLTSDEFEDIGYCRRATEDLTKEASIVKRLRRFWSKNPVTAGSSDKYANYRPSNEFPYGIWHKDMGLPVIERRLSQLTEGDTTGLPGHGKYGTIFRPCEWLFLAVHYPVVLFLDELNRALKPVEQATFQLADSHAFYGHMLHDESRLMIACNVGEQYDVQPMDPAAISRYAVFRLEPTVEDWLRWAKKECNPAVYEFIQANPKFLEHTGTFEENKKYPDRRAWAALNHEFEHAGFFKQSENGETVENIANIMAMSMVGNEAGSAFAKYLRERDAEISALDVLNAWSKARTRLPSDPDRRATKLVDIGMKLQTWFEKKDNVCTKEQGKNVQLFLQDAGGETAFSVWTAIQPSPRNMQVLGGLLGPMISNLMRKDRKQPANIPAPKQK